MLPNLHRLPQEEPCPVSDQLLGELYRASPHGLEALIATVGPEAKAMLAIYCYRRAHLSSIGLAIAASCEEDDLATYGGQFGTVLFAKAREAPASPKAEHGRRKVTLATAPLHPAAPFVDDDVEAEA